LTFFKLFVPSGVPAALLPLIVMIEVLSYVIRTFSLALRLFANMMAGHTLLQILSSFVVVFVSTGGLASILGVLPLLLVLAVSVLELAIAFLQAYVFTILLAIYLNDSLNLH
jgi:ATP synthase subunit 6